MSACAEEPKKKCIFHARKSGCKNRDACEYLHEGPVEQLMPPLEGQALWEVPPVK